MESTPVVLLVDDEAPFLQNLARLLGARGFTVHTAGDGAEALTWLRKGHPRFDVVVLDVNMPVLNGIATLQALKQFPPPRPEAIMLTGQAQVETGIQAIRDGAYDYLMKPCEVDDLVAKIREACQGAGLRRRPVLWARRRAGEILRQDLTPLRLDQPLTAALEALGSAIAGQGRDMLPVLDPDDRLAGVVTRRSLLAAAREGGAPPEITWDELCRQPDYLPEGILGGHLAPAPEADGPEEPLEALAARMVQAGLQALPVVEEGRYAGMVCLPDVLLHLGAATEEEEADDHG